MKLRRKTLDGFLLFRWRPPRTTKKLPWWISLMPGEWAVTKPFWLDFQEATTDARSCSGHALCSIGWANDTQIVGCCSRWPRITLWITFRLQCTLTNFSEQFAFVSHHFGTKSLAAQAFETLEMKHTSPCRQAWQCSALWTASDVWSPTIYPWASKLVLQWVNVQFSEVTTRLGGKKETS